MSIKQKLKDFFYSISKEGQAKRDTDNTIIDKIQLVLDKLKEILYALAPLATITFIVAAIKRFVDFIDDTFDKDKKNKK